MSDELIERFLRYVKIDTQSKADVDEIPSTKKQFNLARLLKRELEELELSDIDLDDKCYLMATLESNIKDSDEIPMLGFICHLDTSPDASGENVKPIIHKNYDGGDLILSEGIVLKSSIYPELKEYIGEDIITSDGTTLLGADDKSGIAALMSAIAYIKKHNVKHGKIRIAFTPDEEIGRSIDAFDIKKFGCKFAYTIDGSELGEISYENFNAASANITIKGRNCHPGHAKNKMLNALNVAIEIQNSLPEKEKPEFTEDREGYFHLMKMDGNVSKATMKYIIRDHDKDSFCERKKKITKIVDDLNKKYTLGEIVLDMKDSYYNMKEKIDPFYDPLISIPLKALEDFNIKPKVLPTRGGTDGNFQHYSLLIINTNKLGTRLSFEGVYTPNIFAGGLNFHSVHEWVPINAIVSSRNVVVKIIERFAKYYLKK